MVQIILQSSQRGRNKEGATDKWILPSLSRQIDTHYRDHQHRECQVSVTLEAWISRRRRTGRDFCGMLSALVPSTNCQHSHLPDAHIWLLLAAEVRRGDGLQSLFVFMDERVLISTNDKLSPFISRGKWIVLGPSASLTSTCTKVEGWGAQTLFTAPWQNKITSFPFTENTSEWPQNLKSKSHIALFLYLKSRGNIIRNVAKKPPLLCLVISFRCLAPSTIMAVVLISAPSQSRLLLHTQGGVKVSGIENKVEFPTEGPLHRGWSLFGFDTIFSPVA